MQRVNWDNKCLHPKPTYIKRPLRATAFRCSWDSIDMPLFPLAVHEQAHN